MCEREKERKIDGKTETEIIYVCVRACKRDERERRERERRERERERERETIKHVKAQERRHKVLAKHVNHTRLLQKK